MIKVQNDHLESMEKEKISKEAKSKDTKAKGGYLDDLDVPPSETEEDSVRKWIKYQNLNFVYFQRSK